MKYQLSVFIDCQYFNMQYKYSAFVCTLMIWSCHCVIYEPNWDSIDSRPLPDWFDKAKVGIFLHWGVYSVPSLDGEWFWAHWKTRNYPKLVEFMSNNYKPNFTYQEFAPQFTAELFDPEKWARMFSKSGAKYVVLTSKHHDGYTLWPSKYSYGWNSMDVGPKRDLVGELAIAVRAENIKFGLYYSLLEWFNPLYQSDMKNNFSTNEFVRFKVRPELEEMVNLYKPSVVWSDGDWDTLDSYWNSTDFLAWLYNQSPVKDDVVANDRWGQGTYCVHGGFMNCQDKYNPETLQKRKWENAMTIDRSWGYRRVATLADYKTIHQLIVYLAKTVSCGGNILINVGPTKDGTIIPLFEERLLQLGDWLNVNGEAIYESTPWKHQNDTVTKGVWYTQRDGQVYAIVLNYPSNGQVQLGGIKYSHVKSVHLLGYDGEVKWGKNNLDHTIVHFPHLNPTMPVKYAYVFRFKMNILVDK